MGKFCILYQKQCFYALFKQIRALARMLERKRAKMMWVEFYGIIILMLQVNDLSLSYCGQQLFDEISFNLHSGEGRV